MTQMKRPAIAVDAVRIPKDHTAKVHLFVMLFDQEEEGGGIGYTYHPIGTAVIKPGIGLVDSYADVRAPFEALSGDKRVMLEDIPPEAADHVLRLAREDRKAHDLGAYAQLAGLAVQRNAEFQQLLRFTN